MKKEILTISREYASGGRSIGKLTAGKLGIAFYDTEIVKEVVKKTGLSEATIKNTEQRVTNSFLFNIAMGVDAGMNYMQQIYYAEKDIILEKAAAGPCVIVGRSADFILKSGVGSLRAFIYSELEKRMKYAVETYGVEASDARAAITRSDRERTLHSKSFTGLTWGERVNYDVMLNSGALGLEKCSDILAALYRAQN